VASSLYIRSILKNERKLSQFASSQDDESKMDDDVSDSEPNQVMDKEADCEASASPKRQVSFFNKADQRLLIRQNSMPKLNSAIRGRRDVSRTSN